MTAPSAFKATFADFRLIKGRKVAQVIVEVPLEEADNALAALGGLPRPDLDRWVAVARLNSPPGASTSEPASATHGESPSDAAGDADASPSTKSAPAPGEHKPKRERTLAEKVWFRCNDKKFWEWLYSKGRVTGSAQDAAHWVRHECGVKSRAEILPDTAAAAAWIKLETQYLSDTNQMAEAR